MMRARREDGRTGRPLMLWFYLILAVISLWMRAGVPVHAIEDSYYDDNLFLKLARSIGDGHWLGRYDNATLVKGAFYPVFIAAAHAAHVPLKTAEQSVYLLAAFVISYGLVRRARPGGEALGLLLFAMLCLNPVIWSADLSRVAREALYTGLSFGVLGLAAVAMFPASARGWRWATVAGLALGLTAGAYWTTREEGVWLAPAALVIVAAGAIQAWRGTAGPKSWRGLVRLLLPSAAAACGFAFVLAAIATLNDVKYGVFETTEVKSAAFQHAYGAVARIKPDHWQRYVVFPKDARARAYAASPSARELEKVLDGPFGQQWAETRCAEFQITPCTGVHAGWFQWVFREAVAQAGHYTSAREADAYYVRLATEIDAACADGRLDCLPPRATLAPPFRWEFVGDTWPKARWIFASLIAIGEDDRRLEPSAASRGGVDDVADMVGPVAPTGGTHLVLRGWVAAPGGTAQVQIRPHSLSRVDTSIDLAAAGDVEIAFPGLSAVRFVIDTDCARPACELVLERPGQPPVAIPLSAVAPGAMPPQGDIRMYFDGVSEAETFPSTTHLRAFQARIAGHIAHAYAAVLAALWPVAALGLMVALATIRRTGLPLLLFALTAACGVAVACRVVLLAYLDATTIPFHFPYVAPASPFLIVFVVLGLYVGAVSAAALVSSRMLGAAPNAALRGRA